MRALGDPLRLRIVVLLARETLCTTHLVEETGARQTNLSNHMKVLRDAGVVETGPCGRFTYLQAAPRRPRRSRRAVRRAGGVGPCGGREQEGVPVTTGPTTARPTAGRAGGEGSIVGKLSTLDRYLAVWILFAMALGLGLGRLVPGMDGALARTGVGGVSLPIALGLLVMMYPGAGQGPLRQARHRHGRPQADGVLAGGQLDRRTRGHVRPGVDIGSADRVELTLPETGVCGGAGLFDDPATVRTGEGCCGS